MDSHYKEHDKQINARINPGLHKQLKDISQSRDIILSTLIERLLEIGVKHYLERDTSGDTSRYITKDDLSPIEDRLKKLESLINAAGSSQVDTAIATDKTVLSPDQKERVFNEVKNKSTDKHGKKITFNLAEDGSVVLRSLKGTDIRTLKKLNDNQLKEIGLRREEIGDRVKFYPID